MTEIEMVLLGEFVVLIVLLILKSLVTLRKCYYYKAVHNGENNLQHNIEQFHYNLKIENIAHQILSILIVVFGVTLYSCF
jgi:hypothetical protein